MLCSELNIYIYFFFFSMVSIEAEVEDSWILHCFNLGVSLNHVYWRNWISPKFENTTYLNVFTLFFLLSLFYLCCKMKDYLLWAWQLDTLALEVHPVELSIIATSSTAGFESMVWLERLLDHRQIILALVQNVLDFSRVEFSKVV